MGSDNFGGVFPESIGNLSTNLGILFLDNNKIGGSIPTEMANLVNLRALDMSDNHFIGNILVDIGKLQKLLILDLSDNKFYGKTPLSLKNLTSQEYLYLGVNNLHGNIPPSLGKCPLVDLALGGNNLSVVKVLNLQFRGASKSFVVECEALRRFRHRNLVMVFTACSSVDYNGNDFKALVYEFMVNGSPDNWLHANENEDEFMHVVFVLMVCLDGSGSTTHRVHVAENETDRLAFLAFKAQITGSILPHVGNLSFLRELWLRNNSCTHQIPLELGHLGRLRILKLGNNSITGEIPANISACSNLVAHKCYRNRLAGKIPVELCSYSLSFSKLVFYKELFVEEYGTGNEVMTLEMFTGKRPTDNMFNDNLSLHNFVKMALPEQVTSIVDPTLFQGREIGKASSSTNNTRNQSFASNQKNHECLISILNIESLVYKNYQEIDQPLIMLLLSCM
ncbi:hypothetical protein TEA_020689 [Camellia sinensis var. sinensis]|uniref:Protein kinase domain-containing protein n=1 Tax=Camellia sinensis var. sinensis TaxID=542762 RepID=A0A4S4D848_CAMSN|nr:hypothetical protein TEA_020689 [Camellia sinensis var. sinensis]